MVAALYVRKETVYHGLEGVDCWDVMRNARYWPGGAPVVAHPPCAQWGNLKGLARRDPAEKSLGLLAVDQVRRWGGVLEHPQRSSLWDEAGLPKPGREANNWGYGREIERDRFGGFSICVDQWHWGHSAEKRTWLYICGWPMFQNLPPLPCRAGEPEKVVGTSVNRRDRVEIQKWEREATPMEFAKWLVLVARQCIGFVP